MFEFPKAERSDAEKFNRNYLKSVIFQVKFDSTDEIDKKKKEITLLFKELLPRVQDIASGEFKIIFNSEQTPIVQSPDKEKTGFSLRSMDGQEIISFNKDSISLSISGNAYAGFKNIENNLSILDKVFNLCGINTFNRVAIRKINIIEFEIIEEENTNPMQIMELILNPNLLNSATYFPQVEYIKQNIRTINYIKENNRLNLRYGLIVPDINSKIGQILVDIDLFTIENVPVDSLEKFSTEINSEIFNIFSWALSEEAKKQLKQ